MALPEKTRKIRVALIGAGIAGLSVANGLLKDPAGRYDVQVYERDTIAFDSERGGYQIRISGNGLNALKTISDLELWSSISEAWAGDEAKAPAVVDASTFQLRLRLADLKLYPKSQAIPREGLRRALLQPLVTQERVHFGHKFTGFDLLQDKQSGVQLNFAEQAPQFADILIASDGSSSQVNQQVGLNNKVKLQSLTLVQSRGVIPKSARDKLPPSLLENGSVMFLGGKRATGFASVYEPVKDVVSGGEDTYTLFWSILIPRALGEEMISQAGDDPQKMIPYLVRYLRDDLGYSDSLQLIMESATSYLRTGLVTSSVKPKANWRDGVPKHSRVFLLGDAVHPMTPGRGMGANQALTDAGNLVTLFNDAEFEKDVPSDSELASLVKTFEAEMYSRAFKMVKMSEDMTSLDLTSMGGSLLITAVGIAMTVLGWFASALEAVGLKSEEKFDFVSHHK